MSAETEATEPVAQPTESKVTKTPSTPDAPQSSTESSSTASVTGSSVTGSSDTGGGLPISGGSPSSRTATEASDPESPGTEASGIESPGTGSPGTGATTSEVQGPEVLGNAESDDRPSERIQVGSQRQDDSSVEAKPVATEQTTSAEPAPTKSNYPPPNVRDQLSPEMEQEIEAALGGQSLDEIIDSTATTAATGDELAPETRLTGTVAKVHREDVFIELGGRNQGLLPLKQFEKSEPPAAGAQLEVVVSRYNAEQGLYEVSLPTASVAVGNWDEVQVGQLVDVTITGANKGGLECQVSNIRGFIPMGQISIYRVENAEEYVGQKLSCVITEARRDRKNLVLSHRALMERERKEKREQLMKELAPGQIHDGVVRNLRDFGAFVDIGGIDGLVHVSQLSWERVNHPKDVLEVGQTIKVRVEKVDQESGKISLVYRDLTENPWESASAKYAVGSTVSGKVTKLMQFGAFVKLGTGVEGLIHISEMGHGRVNRASDVVSEGQDVEVKVLAVDVSAQRIGLSLKALMPKPETAKPDPAEVGATAESKRKREENAKHLKGGISAPSGGEKFGLKW